MLVANTIAGSEFLFWLVVIGACLAVVALAIWVVRALR